MRFGTAYLSGPMTGYPGHNYAAFNGAAASLRGIGFVVLNPAENFGGRLCRNANREDYMLIDIHHVLQATVVVVLPGWAQSRGARTEVQVAFEVGIPVYDFEMGARIEPFDLTRTPSNEEIIYDTHQPLGENVEQRQETAPHSTGSPRLLPGCGGGGSECEPDRERAAQSGGTDALGTGEVSGPCGLHSEAPIGKGDAGHRRSSSLGQDRVASTCSAPDGDREVPRDRSRERFSRRFDA